MATAEIHTNRPRLVMMGDSALCAGFALIGFETWPDASEAQLEQLLEELERERQSALVFLEPRLARCGCAPLERLQRQGGRVIITEIPPLSAPDDYRPQVEELVVSMLGEGALS